MLTIRKKNYYRMTKPILKQNVDKNNFSQFSSDEKGFLTKWAFKLFYKYVMIKIKMISNSDD